MNLEMLNPEQKSAVLDTEGAVLVFAGAGSGKTRVLTHRIAHIVESGLAEPWEILAITFTNKAANEMKARLEKMVDSCEEMWICTIHSMCTRILRRDIEALGESYNSRFSIYSEQEKNNVIKRILNEKDVEDEGIAKRMRFHISDAKNQGLSPEEYEIANKDLRDIDLICEVYAGYEACLKESNALDFDDLLVKAHTLLLTNDEVRAKYAERFKYIHIDEFQDTNAIQYKIVKLLASVHKNFFAVGDDDQSIYSWRGADINNILSFQKSFPNAKVHKLEQNYRSSKKILELANAIIGNNRQRVKKNLWTENDTGVRTEVYTAKDETAEASYVAQTIRSLVTYSGYRYGDIAVLMRLNALSRSFEQEFLKYNVPHMVFGGLKFFERKEIKDIVAYLRAVANPRDSESILRVINVPKRGIGLTTVRRLAELANENKTTVFEILVELDSYEFRGATKTKLEAFRELLLRLMEESEFRSPDDFVSFVIAETDFLSSYAEPSEENLNRKQNIFEFLQSVEDFTKKNAGATLTEYLESVTLMQDIDALDETGDYVTLATIHAVKGLEFKAVFIVGLEEKVFPIMRMDSGEREMEEERRLCYVAITRAEERLYMTRTSDRYLYGSRQSSVQSRFLNELSDLLGLAKKEEIRERPNAYFEARIGKTSFYENDFRGGAGLQKTVEKKEQSVDATRFRIGVKVKHAKFGVGTIIGVKGDTVDVAFQGVGIKSLSLKFAPLSVLSDD